MNPDVEPSRNDPNCPEGWRAKNTLTVAAVVQRAIAWLKEQRTLIEAFFVAVSFHVLLFPLIWFASWTLPWPKPPIITTVIELDLSHWPEDARPSKIEELYNVEMSKARAARH